MKHQSIFIYALTAFLICGSPYGVQNAVAEPSSVSHQLEQKLKKGMAYEDLRKIALSAGWKPLATPECKENVGGEAKVCDERPEVEACSGDGYCNMLFRHASNQTELRVGTYDDQIRFWEFSSINNSTPETSRNNQESMPWPNTLPDGACTKAGYWTFFEAFVRSEAIQKAHTSHSVEVRSYTTKEKTRGKYGRFKIGLVDYNWSYIEPSKDISNYDLLYLTKNLIGDTFRVDYQKAEYGPDDELLKTFGSPGAYVFELKEGCWQLTKELL